MQLPFLRNLCAISAFSAASFAADFTRDIRPMLEAHCLDCHDGEERKGGLDLERFKTDGDVMRDREPWRAVFEKIESHQMPPPKRESQPTATDRAKLMAWIADVAARPDPVLGARDPGKPVLRRLTRLEYNNAVRDLLGLDMDVFIFPERLPLVDKAYFQPASGKLDGPLKVSMREYGGKYAVLSRQLSLPGDSRAEHGFRNRGDAMDFSPLHLEKYLAAAQEIVNAPELPARSASFAALLGLDPTKVPRPAIQNAPRGFAEVPAVPLAALFSPGVEKMNAIGGDVAEFRQAVAAAAAEGRGGVFDVPQALANKTVGGKGGLIKAQFGERTFTINPNADLWLVSFATAQETSEPALIVNKDKGARKIELTFDIVSDDADEGIERLGLCVIGRNKESGEVKLTAVFSDDTESTLTANIAEGAAGTTFFAFAALPGESVKKLIVDGSKFGADYVLLDDIGIITSGKRQSAAALAKVVAPAPAKPAETKPAAPAPAPAPKPDARVPRERLAAFIERAFRRAASDAEVARYFALYETAKKESAADADAMRRAVAAVLASSSFLFIEADGAPDAEKVAPLEDTELATRLALFLWASTPDHELLALAKAGKLRDPATLEAQTRRLLRDARSRELSESFATQWLRLDQLYTSKPDRDLFQAFYSGPQGKNTLHGAMPTEALLLFETVQVEDRSIVDFIAADYTWLNPPLAKLYGIKFDGEKAAPEIAAANSNREVKTKDEGPAWRRVPLADKRRGGFMTMAAPMVVTSLPFRTSPVKRGAWLLETIFNRPPTEPKVAFVIENDTKEAAQQMSIRQKFEAHRNKPACYSCHIRLDPPGFALERFSPIGQWRDTDGTQPVDARGDWTGQPFDGPAEFKALLARDPHEFTRGFIEHLLSYALGRPLGIHDMPTVMQIQTAAKADGWKFSRIVVEIAKSYPFTHTRLTP